MSEHKTKELRKSLRNVVQGLLPEILSTELVAGLSKELQKQVIGRLDVIDQRQKDIQSFMVRQATPLTSSVQTVPPNEQASVNSPAPTPHIDRIPD